MKRHTKEEEIAALEVVRDIVMMDIDTMDYFYSGDKDTLGEAFDNVLRRHNLPEHYKLERDKIDEYDKLYSEEISQEYNNLISFGEKTIAQYSEFLNYIDERLSLMEETDY